MSEKILRVETLHSDDEHSCALIALRGLNRQTINHRSTMLYHVIAGEGAMYIDGVRYELEPGVICEVPAGKPYYDEGYVDMEAVSTPPFDSADVEVVDDQYDQKLLEWCRAAIGAETGRDSSEVTGYELFRRYNDGGFEKWDPEVLRVLKDYFEKIGVVNLRS